MRASLTDVRSPLILSVCPSTESAASPSPALVAVATPVMLPLELSDTSLPAMILVLSVTFTYESVTPISTAMKPPDVPSMSPFFAEASV